MKSKIMFVMAVLFLAVSCVWAEYLDWTVISWQKGPENYPKVLLIGDSIVNGYRDNVQQNLSGKFFVDKFSTGKSFKDEFYWKELGIMFDERQYDMVFFNFGLHDWGMNEEEYAKYYEKFVLYIKGKCPNCVCLLTTPLEPINEEMVRLDLRVEERNRKAMDVCSKYGIEWIDQYSFVKGLKDATLGDGYHYNDKGKELQGKFIAEKIEYFYGKYFKKQ